MIDNLENYSISISLQLGSNVEKIRPRSNKKHSSPKKSDKWRKINPRDRADKSSIVRNLTSEMPSMGKQFPIFALR